MNAKPLRFKVDRSEIDDLQEYLRKATAAWPNYRHEAFERDFSAVISAGKAMDLHMVDVTIVSVIQPAVYDLLKKYGISPELPKSVERFLR